MKIHSKSLCNTAAAHLCEFIECEVKRCASAPRLKWRSELIESGAADVSPRRIPAAESVCFHFVLDEEGKLGRQKGGESRDV